MPLYTADYIYAPEKWLLNHGLEVDETGYIVALRPLTSQDKVTYYSGILSPGFVNAHCHLELSALHGAIEEGTGMAEFVKLVVQKRLQFSEAAQIEEIKKAMDEAYKRGTVVIGDICNSSLTIDIKQNHSLFTHSFIEVLGLDKKKAKQIVSDGLELAQTFQPLAYSLTAHAPYSMSSELIRAVYAAKSGLLSIHLLESVEERELFVKNSGSFIRLYKSWGIPFERFEHQTPIAHICNGMPSNQSVIFVHNTELTHRELDDLAKTYPQAYFCLCPRSNDYIHRTFPDVQQFLPYADRICLGTDSLASNHSLDIFEELKAIKNRFPFMDLHLLLQWLTTNGAKALLQGINFGIFASGSRPGVNLISSISSMNGYPDLTPASRVQKLH